MNPATPEEASSSPTPSVSQGRVLPANNNHMAPRPSVPGLGPSVAIQLSLHPDRSPLASVRPSVPRDRPYPSRDQLRDLVPPSVGDTQLGLHRYILRRLVCWGESLDELQQERRQIVRLVERVILLSSTEPDDD